MTITTTCTDYNDDPHSAFQYVFHDESLINIIKFITKRKTMRRTLGEKIAKNTSLLSSFNVFWHHTRRRERTKQK